jgi:transposase
MSNGADLPDDVDALKAMLLEARASISQMQQDMAERDLEIEKLKAQIDKYKRMQFGSKSEKLGRVIEELETRLEDLSANRGAAEMLAARAEPQNSDKSSSTPRERAPREGSGANRGCEWVRVVNLHKLMTDDEQAEEPGQAVRWATL